MKKWFKLSLCQIDLVCHWTAIFVLNIYAQWSGIYSRDSILEIIILFTGEFTDYESE